MARVKALTTLGNSRMRYGAVAMLLHWGMALLIVGMAALGLYMVSLPDAGYDRVKITLIVVHKAMGMVALALVVLRLAWRVVGLLPRAVDGVPAWQQVTAHVMHLMLYALMLAVPLTGWIMSSTGGYPLTFFGWFEVPDIAAENPRLFRFFISLHGWLAWSLVALVAVHAVAALRHHFVLRDASLRRMLPGAGVR
jgi:cytochrome b561